MLRSAQQTEKQSTDELFATHRQLARRFMWHQKLFVASRVALVVAVVGLLIYVLFAHKLLLQFSPLAFLLALLIPNRGGEVRALEHIDADIGLSYRTALEYEKNKAEQPKQETTEEVDFSSLLLKRAAYRVRNLDIPDLQPWWLPMLATSIVLSLVPFFLNATALNFGGQGLLGKTNIQNPFNQPPPNEDPLAEDEAVTEEDPVEEIAEEDASDFESQNQDDADLESSFEDNSEQPDQRVSEAEGETLSRFLENLKEKPQAEDNLGQQNQQSRNRSQDDSSESAANPEQRRSDEASREQGDPEEGAESDTEQSSGENENGQEQSDGQDQAGQDESGEEAGSRQDGENDGEESAQDGVRPEEGGRQQGDDDANFGSEDNQNGIGDGASEATASSQERLQGQMQAPELLEGEIRSNETTIAGEVRLPGSDQIDVPEGTSAQEFDRAVERAIAEGRIPVEYQEILKNYFR